MTVKEQTYQLHVLLKALGCHDLGRSQVHELLAAAMGYNTYAGFQHEATWCTVPYAATALEPNVDRIRDRCAELGVPSSQVAQIVEAVSDFLRNAAYAPVSFEQLLATEEDDEEAPHSASWVATHLMQSVPWGSPELLERDPVLLEGLEAAARRGMATAHLALAVLLESHAMQWGDEADRLKRQVSREGTWTSPYLSLADAQAGLFGMEKKHRHHLLAAARGGDLRALFETAERYGDPGVLALQPTEEMDPITMADIARDHGDQEKQRYWLRIAAAEGDVGAMRELIEYLGESDEQAWVWMHLSRLLGQDLSADRYVAINEDGSEYDDDLGGPAYVGGEDGIELDPLPIEANAVALRLAEQLFSRMRE
ncbi:MAG: hypothetical protein J0M09_00160 [Xanthomonadales bacterium]|nr:hypothetical protein [Xanthomonadales bacterium]